MVLPVSFGVRVLESPSCWPYAKVLLIYAFENRTLLIFRGVRYLFLLTMYFTIDIIVVLRTLLTTRFTRRRSFAYLLLLFFLDHTPSCRKRGVIQFIRVVPK